MHIKSIRIIARILATECIGTPAIASNLFIGVANATAFRLHLDRVRRLNEAEVLCDALREDGLED
jgi:hypothetical protein